MTLSDYYNRNLPDYYPTMYLDGYEPWQIMQAHRDKLYREYQEQYELAQMEKNLEAVINEALTDIFKDFLK